MKKKIWYSLILCMTVLMVSCTSCDFKKFVQDDAEMSMNASMVTVGTDSIMVYESVEQMPEFIGGEEALNEFISKNITYPETAKKDGIEGRVCVKFIVSTAGQVLEPTVVEPVNPDLDAEAVRVAKMLPNFKPGMENGEKVAVYFTVPFVFKIQ